MKRVEYSYEHISSLILLGPRILKGVFWSDLTYSWFGSFHAFFTVLLSRILRKKSVVVAGGYDVARMSEIKYGLLSKRVWRLFPKFSFKYCDRILAVSNYTKRELLRNTTVAPEKVVVLSHGFGKRVFHPGKEKEDIVITVAEISPRTLEVKGLTNLAETAKYLPHTNFYLVGRFKPKSLQRLREISPHNLLFKGFVPQEELAAIMQRAKVYVQISAHESFGCALAEAMLCECVPVVTDCSALPEVVGDAGFYVQYGDVKATAGIIERVIRDGNSRKSGVRARRRIEEKFPLRRREKKLIETIQTVLA